MFQTLFYFPPLAPFFAWTAVGVALVAYLVRKQGWNDDTRSYLPILVLGSVFLGVGLPMIAQPTGAPVGEDGVVPRGVPVRGYGAMLLCAVVAGVAIARRRAVRMGIDPETIVSLATWMVVAGVVGARLFYVIEYWEAKFKKSTLIETIKEIATVWEGGLVVYGSLIAVLLALAVFVRTRSLPGLALADLVAPAMALGLALGRIGCFANGCCFGGTSDLPWAVRFPVESPPFQSQAEAGAIFVHGLKLVEGPRGEPVISEVEEGSEAEGIGLKSGDTIVQVGAERVRTLGKAYGFLFDYRRPGEKISLGIAGESRPRIFRLPEERERALPIHPAQIYAAIDALLLSLLLTAYYPFRRRDGEVVALMLTIHPISRYLLEVIRIDETPVFGTDWSISQNLSLLILVAAILFWIYLLLQPRGTAWPAKA